MKIPKKSIVLASASLALVVALTSTALATSCFTIQNAPHCNTGSTTSCQNSPQPDCGGANGQVSNTCAVLSPSGYPYDTYVYPQVTCTYTGTTTDTCVHHQAPCEDLATYSCTNGSNGSCTNSQTFSTYSAALSFKNSVINGSISSGGGTYTVTYTINLSRCDTTQVNPPKTIGNGSQDWYN